MRDEFIRKIEERAKEILPPYRGNSSGATIAIIAVAAIVFGLSKTTQIGQFVTNYTTNNHNINITNATYQGKPMRQWGELSSAERKSLKTNAIIACPEIKNIGQGISWDCANKFLADNGVHANNVRDLFRER